MKDSDKNNIRCRAAGKVCYTEREAGLVINNARRHHYGNERQRGKNIPRRKYFCADCGFYHVTNWVYRADSHWHEPAEQTFYALFVETA